MPAPQHGIAVTLPDEVGQALNALGATLPDGAPQILIDEDGKEMPVLSKDDLAAALDRSPEPFISPVVGDAVAFVWRRVEADPIDWSTEVVAPTLVLEKVEDGQHVQVLFYTLDEPQQREEVEGLATLIGCDLDGSAPLPGSVGFKIAHIGETQFSLDDLDALMFDVSPAEGGDLGMYGDAKIKAPYSESDPHLLREITVTVGSNSKSTHWKPTKMPLGGMIAMLAKHKIGTKDGLSWVLGDMVGGMRNIKAVKSLTAVGLDIDTGMSSEAIDAELKKLGCLAIRYSTHSHMRGTIEVPKDTIARWVEKTRGGVADMTDDETIQDFLREGKGYDDAIAKTAKFIDFDHTEKGIVAKISHAPMPKNRVVLPLSEPFVIADEGTSQKDAEMKWRKIPAALARMLGDIPLDKTGSDPNRLFYLPRHAKGSEFDVALFGGPCLDWRTLKLDDVWETVAAELTQGKSKSTTDGGRGLGAWWRKGGSGLQIADLIRDHAADRVRSDNKAKMEVECPFDEHHSNAGDQEDRACLVINAGEGDGEFMVAKCRHESCAERTALDMVGKMLADGWFDNETLEDATYYELTEEGAAPLALKGSSAPPLDREAVKEAIMALPPKKDMPDPDTVLEMISKVEKHTDRETLIQALRSRTGLAANMLRADVSKRRGDGGGNAPAVKTDKSGHRIFTYSGELNHRDARAFLVDTMHDANNKAADPLFTLNLGQAMTLRRHEGRASFEPMPARPFQAALFRHCSFAAARDDGTVTSRIPDADLCGVLLDGLQPGELPQQPMIRRAPTVAKDGRILDRDGWFDDVLVDLGDLEAPVVPENPTPEQIEAARALLVDDVLGDFPFDDDDDLGAEGRSPASLANAVAMVITQFCRDLFIGPSPLFTIVKPSPGVGGTLLAETAQRLFDGYPTTTTPNSRDDAEMQKMMVSAAMGDDGFLFFDNVRRFDSETVKRTSTSERIGGRVLGLSKIVSRPNNFLWQVTGINPRLGAEMSRRSAFINLNTRMVNNAKRVYRHEDFKGWLTENRSRIIGAILTLIRAWCVAGRQPSKVKLASFESFAGVIGGILEHAGIEGFLTNPRKVSEDRESTESVGLMTKWWADWRDGAVTEANLFEWAKNDFVSGFGDERRKNFGEMLDGLRNRTFELEGLNPKVLDQVLLAQVNGKWRLVVLGTTPVGAGSR